MATKTIQKTSIVCSRVPKSGYMTIGKNSSGTNQHAQVTFTGRYGYCISRKRYF